MMISCGWVVAGDDLDAAVGGVVGALSLLSVVVTDVVGIILGELLVIHLWLENTLPIEQSFIEGQAYGLMISKNEKKGEGWLKQGRKNKRKRRKKKNYSDHQKESVLHATPVTKVVIFIDLGMEMLHAEGKVLRELREMKRENLVNDTEGRSKPMNKEEEKLVTLSTSSAVTSPGLAPEAS
jgi:hypothetical protein